MSKIAVIGAGQVGATIAYTLAAFGMAQEIVIVDINAQRAQGEAMDIAHGIPLCPPAKVRGGADYSEIEGADVVIFAAGANQKPGETRMDLMEKNLRICGEAMPIIANFAPDCVLIVVTNPVDVLTRAAIDLTGFPPGRVIGSGTVLDTSRLRAMLTEHTGIDGRDIHAYVLGEHGDSEFAAWSMLSIAGMNMDEYCANCGGCSWQLSERMGELFDVEVRRAAYSVIEKKGATCYAVALAVKRIVQAVLRNERSILTVSSLMHGEYGIEDVCLSLPCVVGAGGVVNRLRIELAAGEVESLRRCAQVVRVPGARKYQLT